MIPFSGFGRIGGPAVGAAGSLCVIRQAAGMSTRPSLQSRLLKRAVPRPIRENSTPPEELCPGLWVVDRRLRHFGLALLPSRTTIIRLAGGSLAVISPPPRPDTGLLTEIDALGPVECVIVPNCFHYLYALEFLGLYPDASLFVAPSLGERVPELRFAAELVAQPPEGWPGELDYIVLGPVRGVSEVLLFHAPSGTLILTDLAFNMMRYPRTIDRLIWRLSGVPGRFGPGRTSRALLLSDRVVAAKSLTQACEWPITRIVVAHGDAIEQNAASQFRRAFSEYLKRSPAA